MKLMTYDWAKVNSAVQDIAMDMYKDNWRPDYIIGITRGGLVPAVLLSHMTDIPMHTLCVQLAANGLEENTIVIYASDQGFFLGEHGFFDKRFMYEESLHMPFIIRYPGKIKPGTIVDDIITNIDFAPTLLEMAGVSSPKEVQGKSFFSNLKGETSKDWQQSMYYHYYEYPFYHRVQPHYGIRNKRYKLIHFYYDIDVWELYDLKNDPNEMRNLINIEANSELIKELKKELYKLKENYGNKLSLEELRHISDTDFGGLESKKK